MEMNSFELNKELNDLKKDKIRYDLELKNRRNKMSDLLLSEMGQDMKDVLNGKKIVKLTFCEKMRYKINYFLDKLFKIF